MRVWIDGAALCGRVTGIQRMTEALVDALPAAAPDIELRSFRFVDDPRPRDTVQVPFRLVPAARRLMSRLDRLHAAPPLELLLGTRPGVFFFPDYTTLPTSRLSRSVVVVYDLAVFDVPQYCDVGLAPWLRRQIEVSVRRAQRIVTISAFVAEALEARFPQARDRITVVSPAVDARFCPAPPAALAAWRARRGLERPYLLCLGTLEPRKNLVGALDAWAALPAPLRREARLVVAGGSGWRDEHLRARLRSAAAADDVVEIGYVPDDELPLLYGGARGLVYPSFYEGFGLPPLEAMACGTPVVASNATSLPEVVGDAGLLVRPDEIDSITAAMARLLEDDALVLSLRARGLARARRFSWQHSADALASVLRSVA